MRREHRLTALNFDWEKQIRFDWPAHGTRAPIAQMWGALSKLKDAKAQALAKASELNRSQDYTTAGRQNAKREHVVQFVVPAIKAVIAAVKLANDDVANIRQKMKPVPFDKTDIAGALRRQEIRAWLRSMPEQARNAIMGPGPDEVAPEIAEAVMEMPAGVSGVTDVQRARLEERANTMRYPDEIRAIATIDEAQDALDYTLQSDVRDLKKELGVGDLEEMVGLIPSVADKIRARLAGEGAE